jgi:two-component system response regulator YesN
MKKVAILDDEFIARNQLSSLLQQIPNIEIILNTANPYEVLNYLETSFIDVLFLDMNMPIMNGLEFLEQLILVDRKIQVIVTSGYADFSYAQGSIRHGVVAYLLKHELSKEVLLSVLEQCPYNEEEIKPGKLIGQKNLSLFQEEKIEQQKRILETSFPNFVPLNLLSLLIVPTGLSKKIWNKNQYKLKSAHFLEEVVKDSLTEGVKLISAVTPNGDLYVLLSFAGIHSRKEIYEYTEYLFQKLRVNSKRLLNVDLFIESSVLTNELSQAISIFDDRKKVLNHVFYSKKDEVFIASIADHYEKEYDQREINFYLNQVYFYTKYLNEKKLYKQVDLIFTYIRNKKLTRERVIEIIAKVDFKVSSAMNIQLKGEIVSSPPYRYYEKYDTLEQLEIDLREVLMASVANLLKDVFKECDPVIYTAVMFVHQEFTNDIRLQDCADEIAVNYSYLSRIFKQQWGQSFSRYLNQVRIDLAKNYLMYQDYTVSQVVKKCGNLNYNYFFRIFKEATGYSPNSYIENIDTLRELLEW